MGAIGELVVEILASGIAIDRQPFRVIRHRDSMPAASNGSCRSVGRSTGSRSSAVSND